jgi:hypothetical protein
MRSQPIVKGHLMNLFCNVFAPFLRRGLKFGWLALATQGANQRSTAVATLLQRLAAMVRRRSRREWLEPISKSPGEDNEAGELNKAQEVLSVVLTANEDSALPLDPGEEALNEPAAHIAG